MINAWQWEKSKAIAFPACKCSSRLNFRVWGQFEINILKVPLMNTTYFICILKELNLSLRSFEKYQLGSGYLQKNTWTQWVDNWAHDTVRRYWSAEKLYQVAGSQCEIKHWYACGADGRKVGWSMYGHVIWLTSMDRFMSPRYSQVMMVSVYFSLTAVN